MDSQPAALERQGEASALADLRWLLLSPPLLDDAAWPEPLSHHRWHAGQADRVREWLDGLPADAAWRQWWDAWQPPSGPPGRWDRMRLGRRAEALLSFYLAHGPLHRLMDQHRPLRAWDEQAQALKTLGEIDFLLLDPPAVQAGADAGLPAGPETAERVAAAGRDGVTGTGRHWELAVKFYLCLRTQGQAQASDYWGPDLEEHFPVKLDKLLRHQLRQGPAVPWRSGAFLPQALTRGCMFHAWDGGVTPWEGLSPCHERGHWMVLEEADDGRDLVPGRWSLLDRRTWLGGAGLDDALNAAPAAEAQATLSTAGLLAQLRAMWSAPAPRGARHWPSGQMAVGPHPDGSGRRARWFFLPPGWSARAARKMGG